MYPRFFQFGHFAIPTYGVFIAIAVVGALALLLYFARRLSLNPNKLWNVGLIAILTTLIGERLLVIAAYFGAFLEHPFWVLGLAANRLPAAWIAPAAVLLGLAAAALYVLAEGLPLLRVLDCAALAATLPLAIGSVGAFLAGAHYGLPTASGWSVTYTNPLAWLWYGTPLAVQLYAVQLYAAVAFAVIFVLLLWWLRRRKQDGELAGGWLFLAGLAGFFLDFYRPASQSHFWIHQPVFVAMVVAGGALLLWRKPHVPVPAVSTRPYTGVDGPQEL
ncbi:MAG TPA: prolipoprotein diacylglyceryl transferase family protein [Acidobacteriaceae bacterium]|nr:prolipoprotein diacylglyceryl transferase family protein [Acidobacteriaceae bacterium]